jgi:hypothetical protein
MVAKAWKPLLVTKVLRFVFYAFLWQSLFRSHFLSPHFWLDKRLDLC